MPSATARSRLTGAVAWMSAAVLVLIVAVAGMFLSHGYSITWDACAGIWLLAAVFWTVGLMRWVRAWKAMR